MDKGSSLPEDEFSGHRGSRHSTQINRALSFLNSLELMAEFDPTLKAGDRELG